MVFPELRPAFLPAGGAVAGGLGLHPLPRQPGRGGVEGLLLETRPRSRSSRSSRFRRFTPSCVSVPQPGSSLEQTHIFVLAHILRRPIIVYGVKYYKSFRGETLGYTRFQGECEAEDEPTCEISVCIAHISGITAPQICLLLSLSPGCVFLSVKQN